MNLINKMENREKYGSFDMYYYDKINGPQDVYALINMLIENGYEPTKFRIDYDNDHASFDPPKTFDDFQSLSEELQENYNSIDVIAVFYERDGYFGHAKIFLSNNSLLVSVPVKK